MKACVLTSGFPNGFPEEFANQLRRIITAGERFAFVASEFEGIHDRTDAYCEMFLGMFRSCGIEFGHACVVDGRMTPEEAQQAVAAAEVVWLAGGDTPAQFRYLEQYGLVSVLREREGVTIGMSAGSINMGKTALCTLTCGHDRLRIYEGLGLVDLSVEPHLNPGLISGELMELSQEHSIYGMCDGSAIILEEGRATYLGDIFLIYKELAVQISD